MTASVTTSVSDQDDTMTRIQVDPNATQRGVLTHERSSERDEHATEHDARLGRNERKDEGAGRCKQR